jgi:hypothetical protein
MGAYAARAMPLGMAASSASRGAPHTEPLPTMRNPFRLLVPAVLLLAAAACNDRQIIVDDGDPPDRPLDVSVEFRHEFEGFTASGQPVGHPTVVVSWLPPSSWSNEVFRVYSRAVGGSSFVLIATVTSCTEDGCTYLDREVSTGGSYEYYVATVNERTGAEAVSEFRDQVTVPAATTPSAPQPDTAVALDNAVFVRWHDAVNGGSVGHYAVYLTRIDAATYLYPAGTSDGTGYVDLRAENGHTFGYRLATVDTLGRVSALSPEITAVPRPDFSGELIYAFADSAAASGFRFATDESQNPILAGTSTQAQWRLETGPSGWQIVPLNGTQVVQYGPTTALACGPASDAGCTAARKAPTVGYVTTPIAVNSEFSYVFRVTGSDGIVHYGVIRATILGSDQNGKDLLIFDWAYQLIPNELRLDLRP